MRLADEVRDQIQSFMDGKITSQQLTGWLDSVSDEVDTDGDPSLRHLVGATYTVLAEFGYGHRTWTDLCGELGKALDQSIERVHGAAHVGGFSTTASAGLSHTAVILGDSPSRVGIPHVAASW